MLMAAVAGAAERGPPQVKVLVRLLGGACAGSSRPCSSSLPLGRQVVLDGLAVDVDGQPCRCAECCEVGTQRRQEHVGLTLDSADLPLARVQCGGQLNLGHPSDATDLRKVDHT
jgi:hypothetical protein